VPGREDVLLASSTTVIPAAASIHGAGGSFFHSDVTIVNLYTSDNQVQLFPSCFLGSCAGAPTTVTLAPGHGIRLEDVFGAVFGLAETGGAVELLSSWPISVTSRLYTPSLPDPTVGMFVPGLNASESASTAVLSSLSYSPSAGAGSRVNVGAYNGGDAARTVHFRVFRSSGELLGQTDRFLQGHAGTQINDLFRGLGITQDVPNAFCIVTAEGFGPLYAYASVIDNQSQDPIFVVGQQDPCADAPCSP
jgi:hypothetical protein